MEGWTPPQVVGVVAIIAVTGLAIIGLTKGLVHAGRSTTAPMLVVSMSLLTLGALVGGLFFNSDSALAIAGAGMGALAGAVNSIFTSSWSPRSGPGEQDEISEQDPADER